MYRRMHTPPVATATVAIAAAAVAAVATTATVNNVAKTVATLKNERTEFQLDFSSRGPSTFVCVPFCRNLRKTQARRRRIRSGTQYRYVETSTRACEGWHEIYLLQAQG